MEMALIVVGLLAAGLAAVAVWMGVGKSKAAAAGAGLEAELAGVRRERDDARALVAAREGELREVGQAAAGMRAEGARLGEQLAAVRRELVEGEEHARELHSQELDAVREGFAQELETERRVHAAKLDAVDQARREIEKKLGEFDRKFETTFRALAGEALKGNTEQFLAMAEQKLSAKASVVDGLVGPIAETLRRTDEKLAVIEAAGTALRAETGKLVRALREPHVRGRYGEVQLRRVAELAGMSPYCDFCEQDQTRDMDGVALRPDMIVNLPNSRTVVVDAKTNIKGYLDALDASCVEDAEKCLEGFARHVAEQASALARKKYWTQYDGSPEFVVMFIPGDQFIDAALARQPELLERAAEQGVILASPSTLIGLLRAVAVGYREQQIAKAAEELRGLGKELHERVATAMEHFAGLGMNLNRAVEKYNEFLGSYERRMEPIMRRFEEGGVKSGKKLPEITGIAVAARPPNGGAVPVMPVLPFVPGAVKDGAG